MSIWVGFLRVLRAIIGFLALFAIFTSFSAFATGDIGPLLGVVKLILALVLISIFILIRWGINKAYIKRTGQPNPALTKFWAL